MDIKINKILIALFFILFSSCVKPSAVICTQDKQYYTEITKVASLKMLENNPPVYEISYKNGVTEIVYGSCFMQSNYSSGFYY